MVDGFAGGPFVVLGGSVLNTTPEDTDKVGCGGRPGVPPVP